MDHVALRAYPRPQMLRRGWDTLNGPWEFAFDRLARATSPEEVAFDRTIIVPFAPETPLGGIRDESFTEAAWYRRRWNAPPLGPRERLVLRFGAVDHRATVWVNGELAGEHEGGYTPFDVDLSRHADQSLEIVVRASDDPHDLAKPRGKQDWQLHPHSIWYPRTTGIWQTVWVEKLPRTHFERVQWSSDLDRWELGLEARIGGDCDDGTSLRVRVCLGQTVLVEDSYSVFHPEVTRAIPLSDPGIDDARNALLWNPDRPTLLDAVLELVDRSGRVLDRVESYTALRSVSIHEHEILLNARPIPLRMVLDQGLWPQSGLTPPDDDALRRDVELIKHMGFNGVRKHQKIEDPRFLYWADRLGLLVWEEMPSAYRFTSESVERLTREWMEVIRRDRSHPCVMAWVPFNESWGVPNLPGNPAERHYVKALYHLTRTLDPTRPVIGNDGWESVATDIVGVHDYDPDPAGLARRYTSPDPRPTLYKRQRYGGRRMILDQLDREHPLVLSEFGGLAMVSPDVSQWGYAVAADPQDLEARLTALFRAVRELPLFAGFCYTQLTDTWQEANGLLYADRTPKIPLERLRAIVEGGR